MSDLSAHRTSHAASQAFPAPSSQTTTVNHNDVEPLPSYSIPDHLAQDLLRFYEAYYNSFAREPLRAASDSAQSGTFPANDVPTSIPAIPTSTATENVAPYSAPNLYTPYWYGSNQKNDYDYSQGLAALENLYGASLASLYANPFGYGASMSATSSSSMHATSGSAPQRYFPAPSSVHTPSAPSSSVATSQLSAALAPASAAPGGKQPHIAGSLPEGTLPNFSSSITTSTVSPPSANPATEAASPAPSAATTLSCESNRREQTLGHAKTGDVDISSGHNAYRTPYRQGEEESYGDYMLSLENSGRLNGRGASEELDLYGASYGYGEYGWPTYYDILGKPEPWLKSTRKVTLAESMVPLYDGDMFESLWRTRSSPTSSIASFRPMCPEANRSPFDLSSFPLLRPWLPKAVDRRIRSPSLDIEEHPEPPEPAVEVIEQQPPAQKLRGPRATSVRGKRRKREKRGRVVQSLTGKNGVASSKRDRTPPAQRGEEIEDGNAVNDAEDLMQLNQACSPTKSVSVAPENDPFDERLGVIQKAGELYRAEMLEIKAQAESIRKRLCDLELQQVELEEKLLGEGNHPEYLSQIAEITEKRERRLTIAANQLRHTIIHINSQYEAAVKLASDTFLDRRWNTRKKMLDSIGEKKQRLVAERNRDLSRQPGLTFAYSPKALRRQRVARAAQSLEDAPGWVKKRLCKKRKDILRGKIIVPSFPQGLEEHEKDEDLAFIRLLTTGFSAPETEDAMVRDDPTTSTASETETADDSETSGYDESDDEIVITESSPITER
ncbi:uncharacterized protein SPPG_01449 [Spizellomyces punctatus DAOM BR117]|uniref:Uncharacterized protein n=1 Tax=Spizellomyces punctatus (strain DAOM BR117) TaxID=645134 RepID=A0A0L0HRK2_SPIPD|nr:uncharacterized protein SPPG_01449 [Spizellomyces punctatus DAOM BR117]KND04001.1 hypothetical protein SPPG_01449 [Spizellomyces punctatus DAOM BR117]|eukprot:XP_016612040.1 hypothetical protein SPPG_01449 [Spizellomyces punctatus DAOM BR117]